MKRKRKGCNMVAGRWTVGQLLSLIDKDILDEGFKNYTYVENHVKISPILLTSNVELKCANLFN